MKNYTTTELVILAFALTVCASVLMANLSWAIRGPEGVPDSAREYMKQIIFLMAGGVLAFIGISKSNEK